VPGRITAFKAAAAVAFGVLALVGDGKQVFLAGVAALGFGVLVVRDLLAPVRLAVDENGVRAISGFAGMERISWNDVDRIRVDARRRYGLSTELLEIDTGDQVHLFSRHDLGVSAVEAAETLMRLRP
jgi:hypothetical protein